MDNLMYLNKVGKNKNRRTIKKRKFNSLVVNRLLYATLVMVVGFGTFYGLQTMGNISLKAQKETSILDSFDLVDVRITPGDRAWDIQKELTPNEDIREMLFEGKRINGKSMGEIYGGEVLTFLKEKDTKSN